MCLVTWPRNESEAGVDLKNVWCVARHVKNIIKRLTLAKNIVLDVSATAVAFLSRDEKCKNLTAS